MNQSLTRLADAKLTPTTHHSPLTTHHSLLLEHLPPCLPIPPTARRVARIADERRNVVPPRVAPAPAGLYDLPPRRPPHPVDLPALYPLLFGGKPRPPLPRRLRPGPCV